MDEIDARRLQAGILRAVRATCPGWLNADIEDLAQAATLKVLERFQTHEDAANELPMSYLWRTAHSVVVDEIRRRRRRPEVSPDDGFRDRTPAGDAEGPEAVVAMSRLSAAVRGCLERVATARRRAVSLHLLGYGAAEIAGLCGWGAKRAENLVYRGLADLRACLRSKGYGYER
ncbi:MAG: RNA polymerase sigma factor [Acidobacteria bacterium]|nr:RNA polymerase sigma factor [Acidobacteriota bacterium]